MKVTRYMTTRVELSRDDIDRYVQEGIRREHGLDVGSVLYEIESEIDSHDFYTFERKTLVGASAEAREPIESDAEREARLQREQDDELLRAAQRQEASAMAIRFTGTRGGHEVEFESPEVEEQFREMQQRHREARDNGS